MVFLSHEVHSYVLTQLEDEKERILSGRLNDEIVKNAHLIEENSHLKRQLERNQKSTPLVKASETSNEASTDGTGATVSREEYHHLAEKFEELYKRHQEAAQRIKYLERKNVAVMQKNKEMKESVLAWQKYYDRHHAKEERRKQLAMTTSGLSKVVGSTEDHPQPAIPSSPGSSVMKTPPPLTELDQSSPAAISYPSLFTPLAPKEPHTSVSHENQQHNTTHTDEDGSRHSNISPHPLDGHSEPREDQEHNIDMPDAHDISYLPGEQVQADEKISSSQTEDDVAQDDQISMPPPRAVDDDDLPQVVSERSLKRKRRGSATVQVYRDQVPSSGTPINPYRVKEEPRSSPPIQETPYKLLRKETLDLDELGPHAITTPSGRRLRGDYTTRIASLRHQRSTSEPMLMEDIPQGGGLKANLSPLISSDTAVAEGRALSEPFEQPRSGILPLGEIDPNAGAAVHVNYQTPNKRLRRDDDRLATKYRILAEDGEEPPIMDENNKRLTPQAARAKHNSKLRVGQNMQTPAKRVTKTPTTAPAKLDAAEPETPEATKQARKFAPVLTAGPPKARSEPRPKRQPSPQSRIRDRPLSELKLSDFKPNPKFNQGYSYAFAETVRKRADRACLLGCTRPECCGGAFRALAEAGPPLSSSQEEKLLEDYLGDAYDTMQLTQMSSDERNELIVQARTRELANKHGKHRHAYERHNTPPGFWDVGWPSTQEQQKYAEQAKELEKRMIAERRQEAMRKGGRYMFRDE
jgi:hypothetical protein